jgi:hypothetical protein
VPDALRRAGATVHVHDELFVPGTPDEEWLGRAGREKWLVITKDRRIRYHKNEHHAVLRNNAMVVVLVSKDSTGVSMAEMLVASIPSMRRFVAKNKAPFIASLTRDGRITRLI